MNSFVKKLPQRKGCYIFINLFIYPLYIPIIALPSSSPTLQVPAPITLSPSQRKRHLLWVPLCPGTSSLSRNRIGYYFRQICISRHLSHAPILRFSRFSRFYNSGKYLLLYRESRDSHYASPEAQVLSMWERFSEVCGQVLIVLLAYTFLLSTKGPDH